MHVASRRVLDDAQDGQRFEDAGMRCAGQDGDVTERTDTGVRDRRAFPFTSHSWAMARPTTPDAVTGV
jgi:hypothetical protein